MTCVVCVSDLHENLIDIPPCDLLCIAGDISYAFKGDLVAKQKFLVGPFTEWLRSVPADRIVIVAGNHDQSIEQWGWPINADPLCKAVYLQDAGAELCGLSVWGTPWQPWFYSWAFNAPRHDGEEFLAEKFAMIPDDTDIVICHGPPYELGDGVGDPSRPLEQEHVGSVALREALARVAPRLCVVGHIHSGYGEYKLGPTTVCNAAIVNEKYEPVHEPFVYDL